MLKWVNGPGGLGGLGGLGIARWDTARYCRLTGRGLECGGPDKCTVGVLTHGRWSCVPVRLLNVRCTAWQLRPCMAWQRRPLHSMAAEAVHGMAETSAAQHGS
eukprot:363590-Chlamydomonas_euryale.AAC.12